MPSFAQATKALFTEERGLLVDLASRLVTGCVCVGAFSWAAAACRRWTCAAKPCDVVESFAGGAGSDGSSLLGTMLVVLAGAEPVRLTVADGPVGLGLVSLALFEAGVPT